MPNTGTAEVDFGVFPGGAEASVVITGQTTLVAGSRVEAWISLDDATTDHSTDEHRIEPLKITAGTKVAGTGFTIYAEAITPDATPFPSVPYGKYTVQWAWASQGATEPWPSRSSERTAPSRPMLTPIRT